MFVLKCNIEIGNLTFDQVVDVKITRSVDLLSDTAVIKLPAKFVLKGSDESQQTEKEIKVGDVVSITLAYKNNFKRTEFKGFVTKVKPTTPVEIICEDSVWKIRQKSCNKNFKKTNLKSVLDYIVSETGVAISGNIPEVKFHKFLLKNINGAQALQKIKQEYGLSIFLDDDNNLFAGLRQTEGVGKEVVYDLYYNIIKNNLEFKTADEIKIKIKAKGWKSNNTYVEVEVGDKDGALQTWQTHQIQDKKGLEKFAKSKLLEQKYDGYTGNVISFLIPFADRSMTANVIDERYPERKGKYFIPKVVILFGTKGARRIVTLGRKISA